MISNNQPICTECGFTERYCDCKEPNFVDNDEFEELQKLKKPKFEQEEVSISQSIK